MNCLEGALLNVLRASHQPLRLDVPICIEIVISCGDKVVLTRNRPWGRSIDAI